MFIIIHVYTVSVVMHGIGYLQVRLGTWEDNFMFINKFRNEEIVRHRRVEGSTGK